MDTHSHRLEFHPLLTDFVLYTINSSTFRRVIAIGPLDNLVKIADDFNFPADSLPKLREERVLSWSNNSTIDASIPSFMVEVSDH